MTLNAGAVHLLMPTLINRSFSILAATIPGMYWNLHAIFFSFFLSSFFFFYSQLPLPS